MLVSFMTMPVLAEDTEISSSELKQRVALLKRFKELLKAQRERLRVYLDSLDRQKDIIQGGTTDDLIRHVELEENIISDIFSIQKVIDPLEQMYHSVKQDFSQSEGLEVSSLKETLENLKADAAVRSERNKELLSRRMVEIRSEIKSLRNNPYARRRTDPATVPTQIDIRG